MIGFDQSSFGSCFEANAGAAFVVAVEWTELDVSPKPEDQIILANSSGDVVIGDAPASTGL